MKINVGTKNQVKISAVKQVVGLYPGLFPHAEVGGVDVDIELYGHPKSLVETIEGARGRAKAAFRDCDFSFGLEGGLMEVPHSKTGFMEIGACAVYDGKDFYLGLSSAFEWPKQVTKMIVKSEADASSAFKVLGLTEHEKLGAAEGGILGFLTGGRMTREEQTRQSIITALVQLERKELY